MFKLRLYNYKLKRYYIKCFDCEFDREKYIRRCNFIPYLCVIEKLT